jgi:hypothetical protein
VHSPGVSTFEGNRHYDWTVISKRVALGEQIAAVVMLRNPISRAVSHFHFAKGLGWTKGKMIRAQVLND